MINIIHKYDKLYTHILWEHKKIDLTALVYTHMQIS